MIDKFCLVGTFVSIMLLPMLKFNLATSTTIINKSENLIAGRRVIPILTAAPPGGDTNSVKGAILIPETSNISQKDSPDPDPLLARFTEELYFQIKLDSDPKEIEKIEIYISKNNQDTGETNEIYKHIEKLPPYCFFEGAYPCGSIDKFWRDGSKPDGPLTNKRVENGEYGAYIEIYRKNNSQPAQWFFRFEIQRPS